jgi:hypothetical protein
LILIDDNKSKIAKKEVEENKLKMIQKQKEILLKEREKNRENLIKDKDLNGQINSNENDKKLKILLDISTPKIRKTSLSEDKSINKINLNQNQNDKKNTENNKNISKQFNSTKNIKTNSKKPEIPKNTSNDQSNKN